MIRIRRAAGPDEGDIRALADVLIDCVEGGASVSFMAPMTREKAESFWRRVLESAARDERIVLVAEREPGSQPGCQPGCQPGSVVGTVQIVWAESENQPHRADLAKMLVLRQGRRHGVGEALLAAAEREARAAGKTLLVLDTASTEAERLYRRGGWHPVGVIPAYALLPDGTPCATTYFYKSLVG